MTLDVEAVEQKKPFLGRQKVHDPESKRFVAGMVVDRSRWVSRTIQIYDPKTNPNQCHGECTGVAKCIQMNAMGNRVKGVVLNMDDAHTFYHYATVFDPFDGTWPPADTGSSGLASAKAAQKVGIGGEYRHIFNGADGVVQSIMEGHVVSVGTWWYEGMLEPDAHNVIVPIGDRVGGHQYAARGYGVKTDMVLIRCWWGDYKDVHIKREDLNRLILDGGDAHVQDRIK